LSEVAHGVSTRKGGTSSPPFHTLNLGYATADAETNVAENRRRFVEAAGLGRKSIVCGRISHGNDVAVLRGPGRASRRTQLEPVRAGSVRRGAFFDADAAITDVPDIALMLTFGDCVPLLFADARTGVVGAAHAGWRGTARAIAAEVVRAMQRECGCDPADIVVGIGPSIGPCCYAVAQDVLEAFTADGQQPVAWKQDGRFMLDLWGSNEQQLVDAGVLPPNIENPRLCTSCSIDRFFSHRAEGGKTGRFGVLISCG
jgi:YfiH family protein